MPDDRRWVSVGELLDDAMQAEVDASPEVRGLDELLQAAPPGGLGR